MSRALNVYLRRQMVGQLIQNEHGQMTFGYAERWLNDAKAIPLSHSLPLSRNNSVAKAVTVREPLMGNDKLIGSHTGSGSPNSDRLH